MVDSEPRWRLSPTNWPIQSDHLLIADYDNFWAGTLTCTFLESRSMTVDNLFIYLKPSGSLRALCTSLQIPFDVVKNSAALGGSDLVIHGLRTPNEGINQIYLKIWADVADKICFGRT
jgi:hypothetical protein